MSTQSSPQGFRVFALIWAGQMVSQLGSALTRFALGVWVYQATQSTIQLSVITMLGMLPLIVLSPVAGTIVDRWDRRRVMLGANIGAALSILAIAILYLTGQLAAWHIYLAVASNAAFNAFLWPAYTASMTLLVPKQHLGRANGLVQLAQAGEYVISPIAGGVLLLAAGLNGILLIDVATFGLAFTALAVLRIPSPVQQTDGAAKGPFVAEMLFGWRYLTARPGLLGLIVLWGASGFLLGMASVLTAPLILDFASPAVLGTVMSVGGVGMLAGSVVMSAWGGSKRRVRTIYIFMYLEGLGLLGAGWRPSPVVFAAFAFVFFFAFPIVNGCTQAILQSKVAPEVQGRVLATSNMIAWASMPLGYLAAGPLADRVFKPLLVSDGPLAATLGPILGTGPGRGIGLLFVVAGVLYCVIATAGTAYRRLREVERELPDAGGKAESPSPPAEAAEPSYATAS